MSAGLHIHAVHFYAKEQHLIRDLSLSLPSTGISVLLGHNGAGKSLLLRLIHGLLRPTQGRIEWCGQTLRANTLPQAMLFQTPVLLRRSALDNVIYPLCKHGIKKPEARRRGHALLERLGLPAVHARPARALSGGEQQRVALARALTLKPQLLLLDEPSASLDPHATQVIEQITREEAARGCKVLMTTHDLGQAKRLAHDISFLHAGQVSEHTPAEAFFSSPQSAAGRAYLAGQLPEPSHTP